MATIKNDNPVFDLVNGIKCIVLDDRHFGDLGTQYPYFYNGKIFHVVGTSKKGTSAKKYHYTIDGDETLYKRDITAMKKHLGCEHIDHYTPREESASVNDGEKASNTKRSKRSANETAAQIQTKYADTIKAVRDKVGKLQDDDRILSALNLLCTMIDSVATERIENITNAAKAAHLANVARREQATAELNQKQAEVQAALASCNFAKVAVLGNAAKELQAELILLEQKIAEYEAAQIASEATEPAVDESEESVSE